MDKTSQKKSQTTVRLPPDLHTRLRDVAKTEKKRVEWIIESAIKAELARLTAARFATVSKLSPEEMLAYRFLQMIPTPVAIKDDQALLLWVNLAYEAEFRHSLTELRGKRFSDLGMLSWERETVEKEVAEVLASDWGAHFRIEPVLFADEQKKIPYCVHRFMFSAGGSHRFLGDVSFNWTQMIPTHRKLPADWLERSETSFFPPGVEGLLHPFIVQAPVSIAIKDASYKIVFCNKEFAGLAQSEPKELLGRTSQEIWNLSDAHPIVANDISVLTARVWMYAFEQLQKGGPHRVSLRFPILADDGHFSHIGVISCNPGQKVPTGNLDQYFRKPQGLP